MRRIDLVGLLVGATVIIAFATLFSIPALPEPSQYYSDPGTSQWFQNLKQPGTGMSCCDQSDCAQASSEPRADGWWAKSNVTGQWFPVDPAKILPGFSIFPKAILCESPHPKADGSPSIYCFVRPPSFM